MSVKTKKETKPATAFDNLVILKKPEEDKLTQEFKPPKKRSKITLKDKKEDKKCPIETAEGGTMGMDIRCLQAIGRLIDRVDELQASIERLHDILLEEMPEE